MFCRSAIIEGKLRGSLQCTEKAEFKAPAKVQGKLRAPLLVIGKKADVQFFRQLHVGSIEIRGRMTGEIVAETVVTIRSTGSLDGNVVARSINVEKGGTFSGQLAIGQEKAGSRQNCLPGSNRPSHQQSRKSRQPPPAPVWIARNLLIHSRRWPGSSRGVRTSGWAVMSTCRV